MSQSDSQQGVRLQWKDWLMVADEPFPGRVSGFHDDGTIGVNFTSGYRKVARSSITWSSPAAAALTGEQRP